MGDQTVQRETPVVWIGIDPGIKGGIAHLLGARTSVFPMPVVDLRGRTTYDIEAIVNLLRFGTGTGAQFGAEATRRMRATLERQQPMPAMLARAGGSVVGAGGGIANYHRGLGRGLFEGILSALGIPYDLVGPRQWQDEMLPLKGGDTKARSIAAAQKLFPDVSLLPTVRSRKPSDGMADALCLAAFGKRRWTA